MPELRLGERPEQASRCAASIAAALEVISKECGGEAITTIPIDRQSIIVVDAPQAALTAGIEGRADIPLEEKIKVIAESEWATHWAEGICSKVAGFEPGTPEFKQCYENARYLAARRLLGLS